MESFRRLLLQATLDYPRQRGWNLSASFRNFRRLFFEYRAHSIGWRAALKCALSGKHFVEDRAQTEDVAARIDLLAAQLLGSHVAHSAHDGAGLRSQCGHGVLTGIAANQLGQPEVEDLDYAVAGDKQVFWFKVAMNDSAIMSCSQSLSTLQSIFDCFANRQRSRHQPLSQRLALQQFHNYVGRTRVGRAKLIDAEDVGVVQSRRSPSFLLKAPQAIFIAGQRIRQNFDRDFALQASVTGTVHLSHSACADHGQDLAVA